MGISGNPAVVMTDEDQIAETFQFVAGISDGAAVGGFDGGPRPALILMPSLARPLPMVPYLDMTVPRTGHANLVLRFWKRYKNLSVWAPPFLGTALTV